MFRRLLGLGASKPPEPVRIEGEGKFDFDIVGESYYQDALSRICGGKREDGHEHYCTAHLVAEPDNPYDRNAVAVYIEGHKVGHIPRAAAPRMAKSLRGQTAAVDAVIVGGWRRADDEGSFGVKLDI